MTTPHPDKLTRLEAVASVAKDVLNQYRVTQKPENNGNHKASDELYDKIRVLETALNELEKSAAL